MALFQDPQWPRAATWLNSEAPGARRTLGVLSVPLNASITPGRCDLAPGAIRSALQRYSLHDCPSGHSLSGLRAVDLGDVETRSAADALEGVRTPISAALQTCDALVLLGGDNSITRPCLRALSERLDRIGLLTLDAHLDVRDSSGGPTNGNPVRMLIEDGLPGSNVVQIGLQSFANSSPYADYANQQGIQGIPVTEVWKDGIEKVLRKALASLAKKVDTIYVDLDLDVMDRAFAPACPGSRPGGLLPVHVRQAARIVGAHPKVKAMDIVEMDPTKDIADVTALAGAACLLEFAAGLMERP